MHIVRVLLQLLFVASFKALPFGAHEPDLLVAALFVAVSHEGLFAGTELGRFGLGVVGCQWRRRGR